MEEAKNLLRETNLPVAEICSRVGYSDRKHFTSVFHKFTGLNPGEYRKLYGYERWAGRVCKRRREAMKKQGEKTWTRHLFFRAAVLAAAGAALIALLLAAGFLSGVSGRFYPWLWAAGAAAFRLLLWVGAVWLVRPYLRMEQTMRLFLEGYTTGKLTDFMDVTAGPAEELFL